MQVRYRLPRDDEDEGQQTHPADWTFLSSNRLLIILFVAFFPVMMLAGLGIKESLVLGFLEVLAIMLVVFYPQNAL